MKYKEITYSHIISFLFVLSIGQIALTQQNPTDTVVVEPNTSKNKYSDEIQDYGVFDEKLYENNRIQEDDLAKYQNDSAFHYTKKGNLRSPAFNWFNAFFRALQRFLESLFGFNIPSWVFFLIKWIFILGLVTLCIYFLARFAGIKIHFKRKPKPTLNELTFETIEENLEEVDFDDLLKQAIKEKAYRIAIRLFFLKNLQSLSKHQFITWAIDKTNNEYKYELAQSDLKQGFTQTVYLFEHIWYGHFDLNDQEFQDALNTFRKFQNQITNEK